VGGPGRLVATARGDAGETSELMRVGIRTGCQSRAA
jgi:hypothetical protein